MKVQLDRVEGEWAVVLWQDAEVNIPRSWLAKDINDGDHFSCSFQKVDQSAVSRDVESVLERLESDQADLDGFEL